LIRPTARPRAIATFAAVLLMAACAGPQVDARPQDGERTYSTSDARAPMSIGDIVLQLESGRPEADIVAELFDRGLAAPATPGDLTLLRRAGASEELLQAVHDAPVARTDSAGNVVIIREPAYVVPYVVDPWPHYYYPGYRHWSPPRHVPPHRPPPHRIHPHPDRPGGVHRPPRPPVTQPNPTRPPAPNRYGPRPQPTPGVTPPAMRQPAVKPGARPSTAPRPNSVTPNRPTR
jgi:hypothetical protein